MIQTGRAERVVVIAGDNASSDTLMPWLGNGFRALGAANINSDVSCIVERLNIFLGHTGLLIIIYFLICHMKLD